MNGSFGGRIRSLREAMDLSLRDLADRSGVSAPMLSQVERGETSPTLALAERIAMGLELSLSQLLRLDETDGVSVVRAGERRRGGRPGHRYEVLTPPLPGLRAELSAAEAFHPGRAVARAHAALRDAIPFLDRDRALDGEVAAAVRLVEEGALLAAIPRTGAAA